MKNSFCLQVKGYSVQGIKQIKLSYLHDLIGHNRWLITTFALSKYQSIIMYQSFKKVLLVMPLHSNISGTPVFSTLWKQILGLNAGVRNQAQIFTAT